LNIENFINRKFRVFGGCSPSLASKIKLDHFTAFCDDIDKTLNSAHAGFVVFEKILLIAIICMVIEVIVSIVLYVGDVTEVMLYFSLYICVALLCFQFAYIYFKHTFTRFRIPGLLTPCFNRFKDRIGHDKVSIQLYPGQGRRNPFRIVISTVSPGETPTELPPTPSTYLLSSTTPGDRTDNGLTTPGEFKPSAPPQSLMNPEDDVNALLLSGK